MRKQLFTAAGLLAAITFGTPMSFGAILEGFNEAGKITDISPGGPAGHVVSGVVVDGIAPSEGDAYAYLTTGPDVNGLGSSGIDRTGNGDDESEVAIGTVGFTLGAAMGVAFDYDLLTSEVSAGVPDPFEIKLDGVTVEFGVVAYENGSFPIVEAAEFDGVEYFGPDGSIFVDGRIGWTTVDLGTLVAGFHELEFFVGDDFDDVEDTALLVDNLRTRNGGEIPEPSTMAIWAIFGLTGIALCRRRNY